MGVVGEPLLFESTSSTSIYFTFAIWPLSRALDKKTVFQKWNAVMRFLGNAVRRRLNLLPINPTPSRPYPSKPAGDAAISPLL